MAPTNSRLDHDHTHETWNQLVNMADNLRDQDASSGTKVQYTRLTEEFKLFLARYQIRECEMLPLQTEHIEAWFSFIFNDI